jgi:SAM-dependent methyltransferase
MIEVNCNFCGHDSTELVNVGPDMLLNTGAFCLVRCLHCGLIYQNPRLKPDELSRHYPADYPRFIRHTAALSPLQRWSQYHAVDRQRRRLERHTAGCGKLLDVGCATGQFLRHMQASGWEVAGIEPNAEAADYGRDTYQLDIRTGTLEESDFADNGFDVVTLWDVLEHVPDPRSTLQEIARILRPGGLLVASTPNPTCIEARLFGRHWIGWERPRHLYLFPPRLLRHYLGDAGFDEIVIESFAGRLAVTVTSLEYWLKTTWIPMYLWQPCLRLAYSWPLRLATWPVYRLAEAFNQTTTMTVFARLGSSIRKPANIRRRRKNAVYL